jgi:hypothetical protein
MSAVEKSAGLSWTAGSSRHEMTPRPSGAVRMRSAMSNCGSPKSSVPPPLSSPTSVRRSTPTVCGLSPPILSSSAFPASESRKVSSARRSERSRSGRPFVSARWKTSWRLCSCVSLARRILARSWGPKSLTVTRTGTPGPMSQSERYSTGKPVGANGMPSWPARFSAAPPPSPGVETPERSPLMSATRHGTPLAEAAPRGPGASGSCPCRSRRRSARGGSSSTAARGPPPPGRPRRRAPRARGRWPGRRRRIPS